MKVLDVLEALLEAGEYGELAVKGIAAKEEVEHGSVRVLRLPVGVRHRQLIQIGKQRLHGIVQLGARCQARLVLAERQAVRVLTIGYRARRHRRHPFELLLVYCMYLSKNDKKKKQNKTKKFMLRPFMWWVCLKFEVLKKNRN